MLARTRVPRRRGPATTTLRHRATRAPAGHLAILISILAAAFGAALAGLGGLVAGVPAMAQETTANTLVSTDPADGATLPTSPEVLTFTFAEPLGDDDALTAPVACGNSPQTTGIPEVSADRTVVTVAVTAPLPRGACAVSWRLSDGLGEAITSGVISFSVQSEPAIAPDATDDPTGTTVAAPVAPAPEAGASDDDGGSTGGALWFGRFLSTTAILALFGAIVLIAVAWPEGPEYVITVRFLRSVWAVALVGTVVFVVAFTAEATGAAFGSSLNPAAWLDLLDEGWPGRGALLRLVAVVLTGWVVLRPERVIDPTTQLAAYGIPAIAILAVGLSRTGGDLALVGVALAVAHAAAAAVWFGGALLVARVVVAGPGDDDLVHAVRGFNRVSGPAILVTVGTGVAQMLRIVGGGLFSSGHGRVVLLKTVLVAAMVFVAIATRQLVAHRLNRADQLTAPNADRFRRTFTVEAGIGVVVLGMSAWLLSLTPAQIDDRPAYAIERQFTDPSSGLDVTVFLTPSEVGLNGLRVEVNAPEEGISNLSVTFLPPEEIEARGIEQPIPLTGAGTAVLDADEGFPFDVPGQWTMQLTGITPGGTLTGATTSFPVTGDAVVDGATTGDGTTAVTDPAGVTTGVVDPAGTTEAPAVVTIEIIELEE